MESPVIVSLSFLLFVLFEAAAIACAFFALRTARTPQGAFGWALFLISAPHFAVPAYLFLGHRRYPGYVVARRASEAVIGGVARQRRLHGAAPDPVATGARAFERLSEMAIVSGNSARLLIDGEESFRAMFEAIDGAESYILVAFYIIRDDALGRTLKARLEAKARAGVKVRILYDTIGCYKLPRAYIDELDAAGAEMRDFHSRHRPANRFQVNFRNHRKIVIADGCVGFVGGLNVGDEYMGRDPKFGPWRDTHLMMKGPAVAQLQLVFSEDWHWATGETLETALLWDPPAEPEDLDALVLAPGPGDDMETGSLYFCNAIGAARERIWIASPYFVPDIDILTALKLAALRGVDVRILVPDGRDHLVVWLAAFAYFDEVRQAGVQIWRYTGGFMHQKVLVVDESIASVGTVNLDNRSCRLNFEVTAIIFDTALARATAEMLERDFARSYLCDTPFDRLDLVKRLGAPFARLFAPLL